MPIQHIALAALLFAMASSPYVNSFDAPRIYRPICTPARSRGVRH
jgi:hypothetical protein